MNAASLFTVVDDVLDFETGITSLDIMAADIVTKKYVNGEITMNEIEPEFHKEKETLSGNRSSTLEPKPNEKSA